jgi:hypothetical protein
MTLTRIATFKLRSAHIPHLVKSYDMRNAFGTGDTDRLLAAHRVRTDDPHFEDMLTQHRLRATMRIDDSDDIVGLHPGSGGRMGDSNEPELFMESVYPLIIDWDAELTAVIGDGLICTSPITGTAHRIDMGAFIDDIVRVIIVPDGALRQALAIDCIDVSIMNAKLRHGGYAQNAHKQETLVRPATSNATKQAERQHSGTCMTNLIHLGSYIHVDGYDAREVEERIRACNMGWTRRTHVWTSATPRRCKRLVFLANVASRAWSGLAALVLTRAETARIDASLAKKTSVYAHGRCTLY